MSETIHVEEVTDRLYLDSVRMATELTEAMDEKQLDTSLKNLPIDTKRSIVAQYLAKAVILPGLMNPEEKG